MSNNESATDKKFDSWLETKLAEVSKKNGDFISELDINDIFSTAAQTPRYSQLKNIKEWYDLKHEHKGVFSHKEPIGSAKYYTCDEAVDQYFLRNEATTYTDNSSRNRTDDVSHVTVDKQNTTLDFISLPAYRDPAFGNIVMTKKPDACIVPLIFMLAGKIYYPSITSDIKQLELVIRDLLAIQTLEAKFDSKVMHGCIVLRKKPLRIVINPNSRIYGLPEDRLRESGNWAETLHGGFYLAIKPEKLVPGDHEIYTYATQPWYRKKQLISIMGLF